MENIGNTKEKNSVVNVVMKTIEDVGLEVQFEERDIWIDGELVDGGWKPARKRLKEKLKKGVKIQRVEQYGIKEQQSKLH